MTPADHLFQILESLRVAARRGDFAAFDQLAGDMAAAVAALGAAPPDAPTVHRLVARATEVSVLLQASGQGLAAARRRLAEIDAIRRGLGTYGGDGRRRAIGQTSATTRRL